MISSSQRATAKLEVPIKGVSVSVQQHGYGRYSLLITATAEEQHTACDAIENFVAELSKAASR